LARWGLLLVAVTFAAVTLVLLAQVAASLGARIPGLYYLFAACDPPAVLGSWMAAIGARSRGSSPAAAGRLPLLSAACALTVVAVVVLGDLVLGRIASGSGLHAALTTKAAWLAADIGTVAGLGGLALGAHRILAQAGGAWPRWATPAIGGLLATRLGAAIWGQLADVPWPFRLAESALYALVALACAAASSSCRVTTSVRP
jgi:hypothetical protein